ncbi:hypothetical protein Mgra_00008743 [Meloidogyne graminicola]|uniref:Uncharacterized protein n=1 Tax=Meloidogyne graminicola TaxID=189291 RepID=A0A8S9ZEX1_9BILA|nr:hypothetical protein Mgra_00008743 [Meloidogyne graminicola]
MEYNEEIPKGKPIRRRGSLDNNSKNEEEFNNENLIQRPYSMITFNQQTISSYYRTSENILNQNERKRLQQVRIQVFILLTPQKYFIPKALLIKK